MSPGDEKAAAGPSCLALDGLPTPRRGPPPDTKEREAPTEL